jgi:CDP-diacylglycerol---glycerol-3-phosphate 3-phosphatidyltransferase
MRDDSEWGVALAFAALAGSFLVSYTRARAEALGLRGDVGFGSRSERVAVITVGLVLAPLDDLVLAGTMALLVVTAWTTVVQRVLAVRSQLRARR